MSSADWFARRLGQQQEQAPAPAPYRGPQGYQPSYQAPPQAPVVDTSQIPRGAVTIENIAEMVKFWKGGQGNREAEPCPRCGGVLFRRKIGRLEAAPLCEACNYNGVWDQGEAAHGAG